MLFSKKFGANEVKSSVLDPYARNVVQVKGTTVTFSIQEKPYVVDASKYMSSNVVSDASASVGPVHSHPIYGSWRIVLPDSQCSEVYTFRRDGIRTYTSAQETGESAYEVSSAPSSTGFYTLVDTITRSNGRSDCSGGSSPVGDRVTLYIRFNGALDQMIMCRKPSPDDCFGPFHRLKDR